MSQGVECYSCLPKTAWPPTCFIKKETLYETVKEQFALDREKVIKETVDDMTYKTLANLEKSVKLLDKIVESEDLNDNLKIRVVFVVEQNIGIARGTQ